MFVSVSHYVLPNKRVSVKEVSLVSNVLESVLFEVPRRVCLLASNLAPCTRKYRDESIFEPQLQRKFKKFHGNCSWICPSVNDVSSRQNCVVRLISLWLSHLKMPAWFGSNKFKKIVFGKTNTFWIPKGRR